MADIALAILAHPDDAEFLCAGTLIRLAREKGWEVHIVSMTAGDCGTVEYDAATISRIRKEEGAKAAALIGATYHCLEELDLRVAYHERSLTKTVALLRKVAPRLLLTHSPADYMLDHEMTSMVARAAAFAAPVPNFAPEHGPRLAAIPHLYYCDPIDGVDPLGRTVDPAFCIDISQVIEDKANMLACHASQRDWLLKHHGVDHFLNAMREWGKKVGDRLGVPYAEGFRQHLGHGYPKHNLLLELLGK